MKRAYYARPIAEFLTDDRDAILGQLTRSSDFAVEQSQRDAWLAQGESMKRILPGHQRAIYFEYAIPRMGKRVDVVLLIGPVIFVVEYKVGEEHYSSHAIDQVTDYALDRFDDGGCRAIAAFFPLAAINGRHVSDEGEDVVDGGSQGMAVASEGRE